MTKPTEKPEHPDLPDGVEMGESATLFALAEGLRFRLREMALAYPGSPEVTRVIESFGRLVHGCGFDKHQVAALDAPPGGPPPPPPPPPQNDEPIG